MRHALAVYAVRPRRAVVGQNSARCNGNCGPPEGAAFYSIQRSIALAFTNIEVVFAISLGSFDQFISRLLAKKWQVIGGARVSCDDVKDLPGAKISYTFLGL